MFGKLSIPTSLKTNSGQTSKNEAKDNNNNFIPQNKSTFSQPKIKKTKFIGKVKNEKKKTQSLKGSKFRMLNQLLYKSTSQEAVQYFSQHQEDYKVYHEGFRHQAQKWTQNPVHTIIKYLQKKEGKTILDLGCGDAYIYDKIHNIATVRSFDLVSNKPHIEIADISSLPLQANYADISVFCLSLMGLNYIDFIIEAKRVLKRGGQLIIAQVESRCKEWKQFIRMVQAIGFTNTRNKTNSFFRLLHFKSNQEQEECDMEGIKEFSKQILQGCIYKRR